MNIKLRLQKEIKNTELVLDLGSGRKDYSNFGKKCVTLDAWDKFSPDYILDMEKEDLPFEENSFDTILLIDVIEHIDKKRGWEILEQCKKITKRKIFVFTPLYFDSNEKHTNNPKCWAYGNKWNLHKSLWTKNDFSDFEDVSYNKKSFFGIWRKP